MEGANIPEAWYAYVEGREHPIAAFYRDTSERGEDRWCIEGEIRDGGQFQVYCPDVTKTIVEAKDYFKFTLFDMGWGRAYA